MIILLKAHRSIISNVTDDFYRYGYEITITQATAFPHEIIRIVGEHFEEIFNPSIRYRLTGAVLTKLTESKPLQLDLFAEPLKVAQRERIYDCIDAIDKRFGKHAVFLGSSIRAMTKSQHAGDRGASAARKSQLFKGETDRKRL